MCVELAEADSWKHVELAHPKIGRRALLCS
jgi:hypothetical protein